jgi:pimeloyl-ACP methyl ester carboxylesterase
MDVVLVAHGWLASPRQVRRLIAALREAGFDARPVGYKTLFGTFARAVAAARLAAAAAVPARLHLVGFSLGGLVMRALAAESPPGLASLLLIGTPNAGSPLADLGKRLAPTPALRRLATDAPPLPPLPDGLRVGCIAGSRSDPIGWLIGDVNDGRVAVSSALAIPHQAQQVVAIRHDRLPFAPEIARLAVGFLRHGAF